MESLSERPVARPTTRTISALRLTLPSDELQAIEKSTRIDGKHKCDEYHKASFQLAESCHHGKAGKPI
jgi:hypothetical protein